MFELVDNRIELDAVIAAAGRDTAGAIVTFVGTTRNHHEGRQVHRLEYEAYGEMALTEMQKIGAAAQARWPLQAVAVVHRIGVVPVGEASVVIAVSSAHRKPAFEACEFIIDQLKQLVPIWKKELYEGGEVWIGSQIGDERAKGQGPEGQDQSGGRKA